MEPIEGSETSAIINQTPENYPKGNLLYSVQGESLKSSVQNIGGTLYMKIILRIIINIIIIIVIVIELIWT